MAQPVRVMVVDDSSSTRTMLKEALSLDGAIEVVGEAGGGREAILQACDLKPDVVLMDVRMPDMDGVTATRSIISESPATKIVALTWSDDPGTVRDMLTAGAIGYVVKGGTIDELSSAIARARVEPGPWVIVVKVTESGTSARPPLDNMAIKRRFMSAIGNPEASGDRL